MSADKTVFEFLRLADVLVMIPHGPFMEFRDADIRNAYNEAYRLLSEDDVRHLLIDFSQLDYFGSTFVGILIRLARKVRSGKGEAALCHLSDNMCGMLKTLMLLENTKTDFYWNQFATREIALAHLVPESKKQASGNSAD